MGSGAARVKERARRALAADALARVPGDARTVIDDAELSPEHGTAGPRPWGGATPLERLETALRIHGEQFHCLQQPHRFELSFYTC